MNPTTLSLSFCIDHADPMSTLEAVLATARRGGLTLARLTFTEGPMVHQALIGVQANEPDQLELFLLRLNNLLDISKVACHRSPDISPFHVLHNPQKYPTLRP